jgi:uncharacterized protein
LFDDDDTQMICQCNSPRCRKVLDGHDWRRADLQQRYRGYFSWYLQRKIDETRQAASAERAAERTSGT